MISGEVLPGDVEDGDGIDAEDCDGDGDARPEGLLFLNGDSDTLLKE